MNNKQLNRLIKQAHTHRVSVLTSDLPDLADLKTALLDKYGTIKEAAKHIGIDRCQLSAWFTGREKVPVKRMTQLISICQSLNVSKKSF